MTLALIVWLVMTVIPAINILGWLSIAILTAATLLCLLAWADTSDNRPNLQAERYQRLKGFLKHYRWAIPLAIFISLVPSEKTTWYMVGAYAAESAVTSETAGELGAAAKDMLLELMNKAKAEIGEVDGDKVAEVAKAAVKEATK